MKKLVCLALALVMLLALCACGAKTEPPAAETKTDAAATTETKTEETKKAVDTIELSCSVDLPDGVKFTEALKEMGEKLYERTEGRYTVKVYASSTLCTQAELFAMLKTGGVDMGEAPIECQATADARCAAVQLPFAFDNIQANFRFNKLANERLYNDMVKENFNAFPILSITTGQMQYSGTEQAIKTLDEMQGKLVWVTNSLASSTITALGGSPVMIDFNDGYAALQKHTVDGSVGNSPIAVNDLHWEDAVKSITYCNVSGSSSNLYMSLDVFNAMPEADQKALLEVAAETEAEVQAYYDEMDAAIPGNLTERGVEIYTLPAEELAKWKDAAACVYDDFFAQIDAESAEIIRQCIEEANAG